MRIKHKAMEKRNSCMSRIVFVRHWKKTKKYTQASHNYILLVHSSLIIDRDTPLASTLYAHQTLNGIKNIHSNIKV